MMITRTPVKRRGRRIPSNIKGPCSKKNGRVAKGWNKRLTSSSFSSGRELLNIQSATRGLLTSPISRAALRTEARKAFDSLVVPPEALLAGAGRGMGACGRGNVKLAFIVGSSTRQLVQGDDDEKACASRFREWSM